MPIIYPSGACTILLVSTSPAPLQSYLSIIFGFPSEVSYMKYIFIIKFNILFKSNFSFIYNIVEQKLLYYFAKYYIINIIQ